MLAKNKFILFTLFLLFNQAVYAANEIGQAAFTRGVVTAANKAGEVRILANTSQVFEGEVVTTAENSFVVIEFNDGTRMSLRPKTVFELDKFNKEKVEARLHQGGLTADTHQSSAETAKQIKVHVAETTVDASQAQFSARVCQQDCGTAENDLNVIDKAKAEVVALVAELKGSLIIVNLTGLSRKAAVGSPLYEGDELSTANKSHAVLVFIDHGRVTLQENSRFKIEELKFQADKPEEGSAVFELFQGGLRALTGAIGEVEKEDYQVKTPVATIGIRGTGYDLACLGGCITQQSQNDVVPQLNDENGLFASVWLGAISIDNDSGLMVVPIGEHVNVLDSSSKPVALALLPLALRESSAPRPDRVAIDENELFSTFSRQQQSESTVFVSVKQGDVTVKVNAETISLGSKQSIRYNSRGLSSLVTAPEFITDDPYSQVLEKDFLQQYDFISDSFNNADGCRM